MGVYIALLLFLGAAFALGLRIGKRWSGIALRVCIAGMIGASLFARWELSETGRATPALMLSGFAAALFLRLALTFAGPALFQRWTSALALSAALNIALQFVPWAALSYLLIGVTGPESFWGASNN